MADPRFFKEGFYPVLSHVISEAGEVIAAYGKLQMHGPYSVNPLLPVEEQETNLAWVLRELGDLELQIQRLRGQQVPPEQVPGG